MSRRTRSRGRPDVAAVVAACAAVLLAAALAASALWVLWRALPGLLALAAIALAYRAGRRRPLPAPRPPQMTRGRAEDAEVIRLWAEAEALRAERDAARQSARAAWQAAADAGHGQVTPSLAPGGPGQPGPGTASGRAAAGRDRLRLIATPRSGVRDLYGRPQ